MKYSGTLATQFQRIAGRKRHLLGNLNHKMKTLEQQLGLQPGELYGADEQCFTKETRHTYKGRAFEVFHDEMAGPLSQWKAFCPGIGTVSNLERSAVIEAMRKRIENKL